MTITNDSAVAIGIEKMAVYPCSTMIDMRRLVEARGGDVEEVCGDMMITERSVNPVWEDPVTMAVNAAKDLVAAERDNIRLLLVASESGLDYEKPLSSWIHGFLDLPDECRNLEVKHACYGGTGSLWLAASFLLASDDPDAKALVIATDQSRMHFHKPYEFVMGAGAVALLVSRRPQFFALDWGLSGVCAYEVADLLRPTTTVEVGHTETSLLSYLDAVDISFGRYAAAAAKRRGVALDSRDRLREFLPIQLFHAPFGGITRRAHRAIQRTLADYDAAAADEDYRRGTAPSLRFNRRMGGTYAASVFISLLGAADAFAGDDLAGKRAGIYSYGSGSCAEFYSGRFGPDAAALARAADLGAALDRRHPLTVRDYEEVERERTLWLAESDYRVSLDGPSDLYRDRYAGRGLLTFLGAEGFVRRYGWS